MPLTATVLESLTVNIGIPLAQRIPRDCMLWLWLLATINHYPSYLYKWRCSSTIKQSEVLPRLRKSTVQQTSSGRSVRSDGTPFTRDLHLWRCWRKRKPNGKRVLEQPLGQCWCFSWQVFWNTETCHDQLHFAIDMMSTWSLKPSWRLEEGLETQRPWDEQISEASFLHIFIGLLRGGVQGEGVP